MDKVDNPEKRDDKNINYDMPRYNEVLGNFFPESLVGLVGQDSSLKTLRELLLLKNMMADKNNQDLPMTLMQSGKILVWEPNLKEIAGILELSKQEIKYMADKKGINLEIALQNFAKELGYIVEIKDFNQRLSGADIKLNNKFELDPKELIHYLSKITGIPTGGSFSYGIKGRLLEVVNSRLENNGKPKIDSLKGKKH